MTATLAQKYQYVADDQDRALSVAIKDARWDDVKNVLNNVDPFCYQRVGSILHTAFFHGKQEIVLGKMMARHSPREVYQYLDDELTQDRVHHSGGSYQKFLGGAMEEYFFSVCGEILYTDAARSKFPYEIVNYNNITSKRSAPRTEPA